MIKLSFWYTSVLTYCIILQWTKSITALVNNELQNNTTSNITATKSNQTNIIDHQASILVSSVKSYGNFTQEFISCQKVEIASHHYRMLENKTVYIPEYATDTHSGLYSPGEYYLTENGVFVCFYQKTEKQKPAVSKSDEILEYITFCCLLLSLACLFLHFVAFLLVPEMKNLPGKNLASLTVSIFFAYLFFLIGRMGYLQTRTCYPLGLAIYYFMMTSFFWMNTISFNVFRSFRQATTKLRLISKRAEIKSFVLYSLYSWGLPALFLIVVIVGEETTLFPKSLIPGFKTDRSLCWFNQKWSTIAFFVAPFGISTAANAIFFIFSAFIIFSNSMKTEDESKGLTKRFSLYLKLAIIMGLGWTMGLVAAFARIQALWYIFVIIATLQGFFIFLAFTRFRKTKTNFLHRIRTIRESIVTSSTFQTDDLRLSMKKSTISALNSDESCKGDKVNARKM